MQFATRRFKFFLFILPALALSIFAIQLYLVNFSHLSRWKGGGMGMFSSMSAPHYRFLRVYALVGEQRWPIQTAETWKRTSEYLLAMPTPERFRPLLRSLRATSWSAAARLDGGPWDETSAATDAPVVLTPRSRRGADGGEAVEPTGFAVEVWQVRYDRGARTIRAEPVAEFVG